MVSLENRGSRVGVGFVRRIWEGNLPRLPILEPPVAVAHEVQNPMVKDQPAHRGRLGIFLHASPGARVVMPPETGVRAAMGLSVRTEHMAEREQSSAEFRVSPVVAAGRVAKAAAVAAAVAAVGAVPAAVAAAERARRVSPRVATAARAAIAEPVVRVVKAVPEGVVVPEAMAEVRLKSSPTVR